LDGLLHSSRTLEGHIYEVAIGFRWLLTLTEVHLVADFVRHIILALCFASKHLAQATESSHGDALRLIFVFLVTH